MWTDFWRWAIPRALVLVAIVFALWIAWKVERARWDECVKTNTRTYCTMQHPLGAHR